MSGLDRRTTPQLPENTCAATPTLIRDAARTALPFLGASTATRRRVVGPIAVALRLRTGGPWRARCSARLARGTVPGACARKPSAAPGLSRAHWCADAAQQQLARRPGGASRSTRQEKAASSPRHCPRDRGVCRQLIQRSRCGPRMFIHVTRALIGSMLLRLFTARCSANWIAAARVLLEQIVCKRFASTLIVKRV